MIGAQQHLKRSEAVCPSTTFHTPRHTQIAQRLAQNDSCIAFSSQTHLLDPSRLAAQIIWRAIE